MQQGIDSAAIQLMASPGRTVRPPPWILDMRVCPKFLRSYDFGGEIPGQEVLQ